MSLPGVRDDVGESSSFKEFHDHPKFVFDEVAVVHLDDVGVVVVTHYHNLEQQVVRSIVEPSSVDQKTSIISCWHGL